MQHALEVLERHADNPSSFLALNQDTRHFRADGIDGLVAYRDAGRRHVVQFGGAFAPPEDRAALLAAFVADARARRRHVTAVQLQAEDLPAYAELGFRISQIGASYTVDLARFTTAGTPFMKLRNKVSRARRMGVTVVERGVDPLPVALSDEDLHRLDERWLRAKGRHVKQLAFLVGERGGEADAMRRLFVACRDGEVIGYISYTPVFGRLRGWMHDLSRRHPDAPPGVMELVNLTAIERFKAEGAPYLHFGFTPFTGLGADVPDGCRSRAVDTVVRLLAEHGEAVYPAKDQLAYKLKWHPHIVQPEYIAFHRRVRPGAVWQLLRVTRAI